MRQSGSALMICVVLGLGGCGPQMASVAETAPPDQGPNVAPAAALRPFYDLDGKQTAAGTAFVVVDKAGRPYMLTAAHIMDDDAEWGRVKGVSLHPMGGDAVASTQGKPTSIGKAFDVVDATTDLVIWPLTPGGQFAPLKLAAEDPKKNEWVWAVGQEPGSSGPQKAYRLKVTGTESGGLLLQQHDPFEMRGFSGGPIVNARGEVVGSLLGGQSRTVIGSRVSGIRDRLTKAGVELP